MTTEEKIQNSPSLLRLTNGIVDAWPAHRAFIDRHFSTLTPSEIAFLEVLAARMLALIGDELRRYADDYKWMCGFFLKYEMQVRRSKGALEHTDFDSIRARYYQSDEQMGRYMRGLMISQITWPQHAGAGMFLVQRFLPILKGDYDYLEIGPGHGLYMSFAANDPRCATLAGWDVAESSIHLTRHGLGRMGIDRGVSLELHDICSVAPLPERFDAIVISQVLELVSSPKAAFDTIATLLRPGGRAFVNCPVKLLAPDHIRVWSGYEEIDEVAANSGLVKEESDRILASSQASYDDGYSYVACFRKP